MITGELPLSAAGSRERLEGTRGRLPAACGWIAFVCVAMASGEFLRIDGPERYAWLVADAVTLASIAALPSRVLPALRANRLLLTWPVLAILSTLWSLTPGITLYHGVQLLTTILIGCALRIALGLGLLVRASFLGLLLSQVLCVLAVALSPRTAIGLGGEWLGIYPHKNVLGSMMALQLLCAACLFLQGWLRPLTALGFLSALVLLYASHSATALCAALVGLAPLIIVYVRRQGAPVMGIALGLCVALAGLSYGIIAAYGAEIAAGLLVDLGKDRTLTGRTVLWSFALDQYGRHPLLGIGFKAYWESPETTAAYLRYTIGQKLWFFHNNALDVVVAFGTVGLVAFGLGLWEAVRRALAVLRLRSSYLEAWPLLFVSYVIVLCCFENPLFQNNSLHQLLLAAAIPGTLTRPGRGQGHPAPSPR